jgi:hypothetical protein
MTKYLLGALTILTFTGCPRVDNPAIDNLTHTQSVCERSFLVTNGSSHTINIHMEIVEATSDRHCDNSGDRQVMSVPAGQTSTVKANINCEICGVYETYSVDSTDPNFTFQNTKMKLSGDGNSGTETAVCTDSGCTGS